MGASMNAVIMPSLDTKPSNGGTDAIDNAPINTDTNVNGIFLTRKPRRRISRVPVW